MRSAFSAWRLLGTADCSPSTFRPFLILEIPSDCEKKRTRSGTLARGGRGGGWGEGAPPHSAHPFEIASCFCRTRRYRSNSASALEDGGEQRGARRYQGSLARSTMASVTCAGHENRRLPCRFLVSRTHSSNGNDKWVGQPGGGGGLPPPSINTYNWPSFTERCPKRNIIAQSPSHVFHRLSNNNNKNRAIAEKRGPMLAEGTIALFAFFDEVTRSFVSLVSLPPSPAKCKSDEKCCFL
jgi:hypothetical protein